MDFEDINDLRAHWLAGQFDYNSDFTVAGIPYRFKQASQNEFINVVGGELNPYIAYATSQQHRDKVKEAGLKQVIIFVWGVRGSAIKPINIKLSGSRQIISPVNEDVETIGDVAILKVSLPSGVGALKGKVDTGAEICSLHADAFKINGSQVQFTNKELSNNVINVPLVQKQAVKSSDGGVEYRPVIELDIELNGKKISKVMFNLNDREQMEYGALIGQNALERTNFLVDPKQQTTESEQLDEDLDEWVDDFEIGDVVFEVISDVQPADPFDSNKIEKLSILHEALKDADDISLADVIRYITTDARNVLEELE